MATTIPTHSTGDYLSSADWNTVTALNTQFGLYNATGAPMVGSLAGVTAPNWRMQFGVASGTTDGSSNLSVTFPTTFSTALLGIIPFQVAASNLLYTFVPIKSTANLSAVTCTFFTISLSGGGTVALQANTGVSVGYIAIGA